MTSTSYVKRNFLLIVFLCFIFISMRILNPNTYLKETTGIHAFLQATLL